MWKSLVTCSVKRHFENRELVSKVANLVVRLADRRSLRTAVAGGKGAGLARLARLGCPTPPGFVITVSGFQTYLDHNRIDLTSLPAVDENRIDKLRQDLLNGALPPNLTSEVKRHIDDLNMPVAVRSSMVGEDDLLTSCAGQLDTVLSIRSESGLFEAIKKCYASILNHRLLVYLSEIHQGGPRIQPALAIVVQQMVVAKSSGVAFSADPVTGQPGVLIEAVVGPGQDLVEGRVDPDRYRIDTRGVISEYSLQTVGKPVLDKSHIAMIQTYVTMLADVMRIPIDVEWAQDQTGLSLLQVRPVTTLIDKHIYSNKLVSDMIPGLIKPLLWSSSVRSMAVNVFGRLFSKLIGPNDYDFSQLTKRICSRAYTDMFLLGELLERSGLPRNFLGMIAREEKASGLSFWLPPRLLFRLTKALPFLLKTSFALKEMRSFVSGHKTELARLRQSDWSTSNETELMQEIRYLMKIHGATQWYVVVAGINMMIRNKLLGRFVASNAPKTASQQLLKGLVGLKSMEPNREIQAMASKARHLGFEKLATMEDGNTEAIRKALTGTPKGEELLAAMKSFMNSYGFLSSSGTDFSATPWCEDPSFIWKSIARTASGPSEPDNETADSIRSEITAAVSEQLSPLKRLRFRRMLSRTTDYIDMRERISMLMSEDAYQMRRLSLAIADSFLDRGILSEKDEIFFLYVDEIEDIIESRMGASEARSRISIRIKEMEADARIEPSDSICGEQVTYKTVASLQNQKYLVGICGSPGRVTGRARIVHDPAHAPEEFRESDILVVPFTDAGWTPLFTVVAGVVAETGGILSHTSIVAREYGLPAIVNVKNATMIIEDNQNITLDAHEGKVYLK